MAETISAADAALLKAVHERREVCYLYEPCARSPYPKCVEWDFDLDARDALHALALKGWLAEKITNNYERGAHGVVYSLTAMGRYVMGIEAPKRKPVNRMHIPTDEELEREANAA